MRFILKRVLVFVLFLAANAGFCDQQKPADSWFGQDKARHFLLSAMMTGAVTYYQVYEAHHSRRQSRMSGMVFSISLGLGKEISDSRRPEGFFSWKDLIYDGLGILFGYRVLSQW